MRVSVLKLSYERVQSHLTEEEEEEDTLIFFTAVKIGPRCKIYLFH